MKNSKTPARESMIARRDFIGLGASAGAGVVAMLSVERASAQARPAQGVPWWAARPGKGGVGKPVAIDMHAHWSRPQTQSRARIARRIP